MTACEIDSTPLLESYHAFANLPSILSQLAKYEVTEPALLEGAPEAMYLFEADAVRACTLQLRLGQAERGDAHQDELLWLRQDRRAGLLASMGFLGFFTLIFGSWRVAEYVDKECSEATMPSEVARRSSSRALHRARALP
jgi:hypothetical protein